MKHLYGKIKNGTTALKNSYFQEHPSYTLLLIKGFKKL